MPRSLSRAYPKLIHELVTRGAPVEGRGGSTREFIDFMLVLEDPATCIVDRDGFSLEFMRAEIAMLLAGSYDEQLVRQILPRAADLTTPLTAYGPRVREQMPVIVEELLENPESRRAVVYVGKDSDLNIALSEPPGEMPCTCVWQFILRDHALHMLVHMRSWDAVWGLSYDVPCFVAVQMAVASAVNANMGSYRHRAGSFHIYERHYDVAARSSPGVLEIPWIRETWIGTVQAARREMDGMLDAQQA